MVCVDIYLVRRVSWGDTGRRLASLVPRRGWSRWAAGWRRVRQDVI